MHCQECVTKCPKGLSPADDISFIRQFAIANGIRDNAGTRHAKSFLDDIQKTGRLNEALMFIKTEGLLGSLSSIPVALRLVRKGKLRLRHVLPKPIKEIEQVRTIIKVIQKNSQEKLNENTSKTDVSKIYQRGQDRTGLQNN